ncbi:MAG: lipid A deacylase LpxR family protein [Planctomycetota bacterium]
MTPRDGPRDNDLPSRTTIGFTVDNDYFTGSDNNYSNGFAFSALSGPVVDAEPGSLTKAWGEAFAFLPGVDPFEGESFVGVSFGQEIFTPDDISDPNPPLDDQPYAGILFLDFSFAGRGESQCASWVLRVGLVGPWSQADEVQTWFHDITDNDEPLGWDTQLPNEPILNLDYNLVWEFNPIRRDGLDLRLVPMAGASVGTYFTGASAAAYAEFGYNLPDNVGAVTLRQGVDPVGLISATRNDRLSVSLLAGAGGFAVAHFLPLDGTVFRESRSVDSEPLVGFLTTGASVRYDAFSLSYMLSFFTERFETERDNDDFGRVTLSWSF